MARLTRATVPALRGLAAMGGPALRSGGAIRGRTCTPIKLWRQRKISGGQALTHILYDG